MVKILTKAGVLDVDEVIERDNKIPKEDILEESKKEFKKLPQNEEPKEPTRKEIKKEIEEFNENPVTKKFGVMAVKKQVYIGLWITIVFFLLFFAINVVWKNSTLDKLIDKDFSSEVNIAPANISVTDADEITNNYTTNVFVNNTFIIPNDFIIKMQNLTNSS